MTDRRPRLVLSNLLLAMTLLALAGCGREGPATERAEADPDASIDDGLAPLDERFDGAWRGVMPCADCDGIDVTLELQRERGAAGRYRLSESYLGAGDAADFEISGEWQEAPCRLGDETGRCIELIESAQRWFRRDDGSLQAVDAEGRPFDDDGARLRRR